MANENVSGDKLSASESVYGFAAWLTTREQVTTMGSGRDCALIADLVNQFCRENKLRDPRDEWSKNLVHPSGECSAIND